MEKKKKYRLPNKRSLAYVAFFAIAFVFIGLLINRQDSPDKRIIGTWREVSWSYELVNTNTAKTHISGKEIREDAQEQIARELIIHEAETWEFKKNGNLILRKKGRKPSVLRWTLKGRGHVLQLDHEDHSKEFYDVSDVDQKRLILYVDIEIQAKGIVKMTFEKLT